MRLNESYDGAAGRNKLEGRWRVRREKPKMERKMGVGVGEGEEEEEIEKTVMDCGE